MTKWLTAILGFIFFRIPGAIIGFIIGSFLDNISVRKITFDTYYSDTRVSPADFEMHFISLCALVIKADGKVNQAELEYVKNYFLSTYGKEKANVIFRTFNEIIKKREVKADRIAAYLATRVRYEVRLQLLHFLFGIAKADGVVSSNEVTQIEFISRYLRILQRDFDSIRAMFIEEAGRAYKILEVSKNASDLEIKKAYRNMVKKYHPDKVITEDEAIKKGAEEKFKEVQKAYEQIQKEREL